MFSNVTAGQAEHTSAVQERARVSARGHGGAQIALSPQLLQQQADQAPTGQTLPKIFVGAFPWKPFLRISP